MKSIIHFGRQRNDLKSPCLFLFIESIALSDTLEVGVNMSLRWGGGGGGGGGGACPLRHVHMQVVVWKFLLWLRVDHPN